MPYEFQDPEFGNIQVLGEDEDFRNFLQPRESKGALLERQRALRRESGLESADQGSFIDRLALGVGQGLTGIESAFGGVASLFGADDFGDYVKSDARRRRAGFEETGDTLGYGVAGQAFQDLSGNIVGSALPSVGGALVAGVPGAMVAGGLQSAGAVQETAEESYRAQGFNEDEATRRSRLPAVASGLITAALTRLMPGGTEALAMRLVGGQAARQGAREAMFGIAREALKEFPEEFADELAQGVVARWSFDPDKPIGEIVTDALHAGSMGAGIGLGVGAVGGVGEGVRRVLSRYEDAPVTGQDLPGRPPGYTVPEVEAEPIIDEPVIEEDAYETEGRYRPQRDVPARYRAPLSRQIGFTPQLEESDGIQLIPDSVATEDVIEAEVEPVQGQLPTTERPLLAAPVAAKNATTEPGLRPPQAEMPFADDAFALAPEVTMDGQRVMQEQAQREDDLAASDANQAKLFEAPAVAAVQPESPPAVDQRIIDAQREYEGALATYREVGKRFTKARKQFRDRKIDDKEFLAARKSHEEAGKIVDRAEKKLVTTQKDVAREAKPPRKAAESKYERPPDIQDDIESNVGKLRRLKPGETHEFADLHRAAQKRVPDLFTDSPTASMPDVASQALSDGTGRPIDPQTMLNKIIELPTIRKNSEKAFYQMEREAEQKGKFDDVVLANKRRDHTSTKQIVSDELAVGDKFKVQGVRFDVTRVKVDPNDETRLQSVTLKDHDKFGTQTVGSEVVLNIDKGTIRRASGGEGASQSFGSAVPSPRGSTSQTTPRKADNGVEPTPPAGPVNEAFSLASPAINVTPKGWDQVTPGYDQEQRISSAVGLDDIRSLIENSSLSPQAKRATMLALDALEKSGLSTNRIKFEIRTYLDGKEAGSAKVIPGFGSILSLMESARPEVGPHEVFHLLLHALPESDRAALEAERVANLPKNAPASVRAGNMTSLQFREAGLPLELYPFINLDEYAAKIFGDKSAQAALEKSAPGLWQRIKDVFAQVWEQLKGLVKDPVASERIFAAMMSGKQAYDAKRAMRLGMDRATFATSAADALNAAELAPLKKIEGESLLAQASDVTELLDNYGVGAMAGRIQRAFDYRNWWGIRKVGEQLNGGRENYRQLKGRLDNWRRARIAGEAGQQVLRFGEMLNFAIEAGNQARAQLAGPRVVGMYKRVQAAALNALAKEQILEVSRAVYQSAIAQASRALKEESKSDLQMESLRGEIRGIREASESTAAMEQLLNDMVSVVGSTTEGRTALFNGQGGPQKIESIYKDLKRSTGQTLHNANLLKWGAYLLNKSPKLRDALQAAQLSKQSGIRSQLQGFNKKFADELAKNPEAAIRKAMTERERAASDRTGAEFLFRHLQEELLEEVEPLIADADAGELAERMKADPAFNDLRKEILNDQTSIGGQPAKPFKSSTTESADSTITLPSGKAVGIGHEVIDGNVVTQRKRFDEYTEAVEELRTWLADPTNADDPARRLHALNLATLEDYYAGLQALMPENRSPLFHWSLSILNEAIGKAGTHLAGSARAAVRRLDQMHKWARDWNERSTHTLATTQRAAMASHGIKWNNLTGQSIVQANRLYQARVGQELAASWQRQEGGLNVGDTLSSGEKVTAADMAHLEAQAKAGTESLNLAAKYDRQITEDARGLKTGANYRSALRTSPFLLPRMFDFTLEQGARRVAEAMGSPDALEDALNQIWPVVGMSMLVDRNPEFAKRTIFDGKNGAFEAVAADMRANPRGYQTVDDVAQALASYSTATPDEAKAILLDEFGRIISSWSNAMQERVEAAQGGGKGGEAKNSFTQARGDALAPWTFYRTGFTTSDDVASHASGMQSVAMDRVIDALDAMEKDLARQKGEFRTEVERLNRLGAANPTKAAIAQKERERRQGQTYDSWQNLDAQHAQVSKALERLRRPGLTESDFDYAFNRGTGALVGALIGNVVTTMRNLSPIFLGRQLRALGAGETRALLLSLGFTTSETLKVLGSLTYALPRSGFFFLRGMARGVPSLMKGEVREAYHSALRDVIRELAETAPRRLASVRDLEARGLYSLPEKVKEFDNQILGSLLYRGRIPANEFQGMAKASGYMAALAEASVLAVANAAFPTIGDAGINAAMAAAMNSSMGPVLSMETRLRKLFNDWKNKGYGRKFDFKNPANPVNRLSASEANGGSENDLSLMRKTYELAGLSFDQEAAKFMAELQTNPQAQFLSDDARLELTDAMINQMNRAAIGNQPLAFKDAGSMAKIFRPLYGFPVRAFANWSSMLSVPTQGESGKAKLWAYAMFSVMAGLVLTGAGGQLRDEALARILKRALFNQESQNRLPWEEETMGRKVASAGRLAMESVPLLGIIGNGIIPANSPARASYEPTLAVVESLKSGGQYVHGVAATGDPMFGLPELLAKFVPDSKIVFNRLPTQAGRREAANAVADLKRFAPADLARPPYRGGGSPSVTDMSPFVQQMENYAMTGDTVRFMEAKERAVEAARAMGKLDPEKAVQMAFRSRNPETRALQRQMTGSERSEMLSRAGSHADEIEEAQRNYNAAAALIGIGNRENSQRSQSGGGVRRAAPGQYRPYRPSRNPGSFYRPGR